jgi:two-component system, NtrC family, response regulator AtoC
MCKNHFAGAIILFVKSDLQALVIDDEPLVSSFVSEVLSNDGWKVSEAKTAEQAFEMLSKKQWLLVFCDVILGGIDGYAVLRHFTERQAEARFVLMTGHGSAAGALDATAIGAYDYLVKPFKVEDILNIARVVREQHQSRLLEDNSNPVLKSVGYTSDIPLIGKSPRFVECLKMVGRVAPTNLPVLITGESGTGKEIVAQSIHQRSHRTAGSFIAVNCGAIPFELIESELFGHAKGAFSGADRERVGLWEEADRGTILLDEITETSLLFQVKLLRALQQGEIRRVGSNRTQTVDVRVIAATNRDIEEEVRHGRFRQDLMYRLNAVTIQLPPLRERIEDIPLLAEHFARQVRPGSPIKFSPAVLEILTNYSWQGNIRELENTVFHAAALCDGVIYPEHLPERIRRLNEISQEENAADIQTSSLDNFISPSQRNGKWLALSEMEAKYVAQVLDSTGGNKQAAARLLNIDRKTLSRIIKRAEIEK